MLSQNRWPLQLSNSSNIPQTSPRCQSGNAGFFRLLNIRSGVERYENHIVSGIWLAVGSGAVQYPAAALLIEHGHHELHERLTENCCS